MTYKALSTIRHNGTVYEAGQVVLDIDEEAAQPLVADGILESADTNTPAAPANEPAQPPADEPATPPAAPEAPADEAPLDMQPVQPSASSQDSNADVPPIGDQVKSNIKQDLKDSEELESVPSKPVMPAGSESTQPTAEEIAAAAAEA